MAECCCYGCFCADSRYRPPDSEAPKTSILINSDAEAYADLGLVRMAEGDLSEADEVLRIAIRLKPHNADAHHLLDILQANRDNPEEVARAANRILDTWFARE